MDYSWWSDEIATEANGRSFAVEKCGHSDAPIVLTVHEDLACAWAPYYMDGELVEVENVGEWFFMSDGECHADSGDPIVEDRTFSRKVETLYLEHVVKAGLAGDDHE